MTPGNETPPWTVSDDDSAYLEKILRYRPIELSLDESVSLRTLFQLWLRAAIVSGVVWFVFFVLGLIVGLAGAGSGEDSSLDLFTGGALALVNTGIVLGFVVFWLTLLVTRLPEPIAEWRVLLPGRADKADSVYSKISGTLWRRQIPVGWRMRRIRAALGAAGVSSRLALQDRYYTAYVSVFPYGTSLYLGWMMWRSRRGTGLIRQFLADIAVGMAGGRDPERQMMRTERARAMREAVHAACREGLVVAAEGLDVPVGYGFPHGLPPIEEDELQVAPVPGLGATYGQGTPA